MSSTCSESYLPECEETLKPIVGTYFPTQEDGIKFYKVYASAAGFDIRMGTVKKSYDNCITLRYVHCNREGEKHASSDDVDIGLDDCKRKKRRKSIRTGCMARMIMKFSSSCGYVVNTFIEAHNHPLVSDRFKPFFRVNREVDFIHRKFIMDCARALIGPLKAFRMFKESVGSFVNVGCSSVDFKNASRDMKSFVDGVEAQMVLDKLRKKKELCPAYTFDYKVDAMDRLIRLFWCDTISRRNYHLFGDVVSFDATYSTNRYYMIFAPFTGKDNHGKCVTFGAGLLSKEDAESYSWLMNKFVKCMGKAPSLIITDQDLGIKVAVERVLTGTRYRFCIWHIMLKIADKVPTHLKNDEEFKKCLNNVVWYEDIKSDDFEAGWIKIMKDFGLIGDKWFESMYEILLTCTT